MISIITSSCNKKSLLQLKENITETIGVKYELIVIENSNAKYSLTKAYNLGASQASFEYLLFIHEDIIFHTKNWGQILISHLENLPNVGIIGIAGSSYKTFFPSGWRTSDNQYHHYNLIQSYKHLNKIRTHQKHQAEKITVVICLDGVFLGLKKSVMNEVKFNESVKGFHGYDLDYSLSTTQKFNNYFVPDILLEHFSEGHIDKVWIENIYKLFYKWKDILPKQTGNSSKSEVFDRKVERKTMIDFISLALNSNMSFSFKVKIFLLPFYAIGNNFKYGLDSVFILTQSIKNQAISKIRRLLSPHK